MGYILFVFCDVVLELFYCEIELNKIENIDVGYVDSMFYDLLIFIKDYIFVLLDMWCRYCIE